MTEALPFENMQTLEETMNLFPLREHAAHQRVWYYFLHCFLQRTPVHQPHNYQLALCCVNFCA